MFYSFREQRGAILAMLAGAALCAQARAETNPDAREIIDQAVARAQRAQANSAQPAFTYTKMSVTEALDSSGRIKERKEKTYQVVFQNGSSFLRLVEVNGHAPGAADLKKQKDNEVTVNQLVGDKKASNAEKRENFLTPELVQRFDFKVISECLVNQRKAYQITFQPKTPEVPVHHLVDKLLNRISGTLWIDAEEFEVARADMNLKSEVTLLGGVAGTLKKLVYTMSRTRVADGLWLNTFSSGDFEGRKLIDFMRVKTHSHSTNFKLLGVQS